MAWYVVHVGRKPGVYSTWEECHSQVIGYPGALYKKYPTAASPSSRVDLRGLQVLDSGHGRVLLHAVGGEENENERRLVVWDPVTDQQRELPATTRPYLKSSWNVAVLCAAQGCRHLDCHGGHFLVVMVGTVRAYGGITSVCVYSSETGDGWMGFAAVVRSTLYMCSLEIGTYEGAGNFVNNRVLDLNTLLPVEALADRPQVAAVADGAQVVFLRTSVGFFSVDLKSCQIKKVGEVQDFDGIFPYTSFCTPALRAVSMDEGQNLVLQEHEKTQIFGARSSKSRRVQCR